MNAVVIHGGAGTTAAGLRAGITSIIIPFFGDQAFWGWRGHQLGVGPKWIQRPKLTAEILAAAIQQAVSDQKMQRRAASLSAIIQAENEIAMATAIIEQFDATTALSRIGR